MGETTNQIEWEIAQKRTGLGDNLIELKQRAKAAVDWRSQVEERPGTMLAVAYHRRHHPRSAVQRAARTSEGLCGATVGPCRRIR